MIGGLVGPGEGMNEGAAVGTIVGYGVVGDVDGALVSLQLWQRIGQRLKMAG